jgi:flagellar hook-associated protein 3
MRVTTMVPDTVYAIQQSQQALSTALQQVSTGLRVNQPSDDPAASANMVLSLASSADVDQYTKNISAVTSQMQTADSALSSVVTSLNTAITLGTSGASGILSTANKQAVATEVQGVLANVVSQANASYQGAYLFAGSVTTGPPILPASTTFTSAQGTMAPPLAASLPLTVGSVTTISDAATGKTFVFTVAAGQTITNFSTAVANAAAAGILSAGTTATINPTGQLAISSNSSSAGIVASSNDPVLGAMTATPGTEVPNAYAYVGNSTVNSVPVGDSLNVATNLPGGQIFTSGANVIGSLSGLITALQSGTSTQIEAATHAVSTALAAVGEQRVPLDNSISQLNSQESYLGQETVSLTSQQTSLVGANLAQAATSLSQAELTNSAVLAAAAKVLPETLLNYLQPA